MKLVLHIFKKDARRLWPAIALSLGMLAMMALAGRLRSDPLSGSIWLNLLLPLAWAGMVGLAVLQEPLVGERQFWLTRPHRWPVLLAAKLLFALAFVHLPLLLADSFVLIAHGFSPFASMPQLLGRQVLVAGAVTLPAIALAALAGGFTQFIMLLLAVAAAAIACNGDSFGITSSPRPEDYLRGDLGVGIAAIAAIAIAGLQYRRRKPAIARGVATLATLLAGTLFGYVPASFDYRLREALHPAAPLTLGINNRKPDALTLAPPSMSHREMVAVPVVLSGVPAGALTRIGPVDLTISAPDGSVYRNISYGEVTFGDVSLLAAVRRFPGDLESAPLTLFLDFDRALYEKHKNQKVRARGRLDVAFYRMGETAWMPMYRRVNAPGIGHCSSMLLETRWAEKTIEVLCESPSTLPRIIDVMLAIPGIDRKWVQRMRTDEKQVTSPQWAWLAALNRSKTFFPTADSRTTVYKFGLEAPLESLGKATIGVTPEITTGYTEVDFDLRDLSLASYRVRPQSER